MNNKKNIYFFQPAHYTNFQGKPCYWLPYSVGCLWAYATTIPQINENYQAKEFFFKRESVKKVVESLENPDIAVFSCYIWNWQYNRTLANAVKEKFPNCIILFGGPQVTKHAERQPAFFQKNPYVDHIINGEGEVVFADLLVDLVNGKKPAKVIRFSRLTEVSYPSPYNTGIFDDIVKKYPDYVWQAVIETNRGCPYACTFCDWGSATYSKIVKISEERVFADIDWMANNNVYYAFIADANFGILYDRDKAFAERFNYHQRTTGMPKIVLAQWAKNGREKILDIAKIFFNGHNRGFTLSVQSMEDRVLEAIKRKNMETSDMTEMLKLCKDNGIPAYTEMILGLPYETKETWKNNHYKLLELGQHYYVDVWMTQLLENSALNSQESIDEHQIEYLQLPKLITGSVVQEEDILETENIVVSTKYMSRQDFVDSYLFSSIIMHFHYLTGSTFLLSRFLNKYKKMSYAEFYQILENAVKNDGYWIGEPYARLKVFHTQVMNGQLEEAEEELKYHGHTSIWACGQPLILNPSKLFADLYKIYANDFCELDSKMYEQLIDFQTNMVYDRNRTYPIVKNYDYDFINFIESDGELNKPVKVIFEYDRTYETEKQFIEHAYYDRRTREIVHTRYRIIDEE